MMTVDDNKIVQLYWDRNELAIPATSEKYGNYCASIARNILGSAEDAEECVNDTYWNAWNSMPPNKPAMLSAFLGKITRNLSYNKFKQASANKRGCGEPPAVLEELSDILSGGDDVQQALDHKELAAEINAFLGALSPEKRSIFVCRYWYGDSVSEIERGKSTESAADNAKSAKHEGGNVCIERSLETYKLVCGHTLSVNGKLVLCTNIPY